jgi:hypothetical protein
LLLVSPAEPEQSECPVKASVHGRDAGAILKMARRAPSTAALEALEVYYRTVVLVSLIELAVLVPVLVASHVFGWWGNG